MKDKFLRKLIFGNTHGSLGEEGCRVYTVYLPKADDEDKPREITYRGDDGLLLYLLKRIEKLEAKIDALESRKK